MDMDASEILIVAAGLVLVFNGLFQMFRRYIFLRNRCTAAVSGKILDMEIDAKNRDNSISDTTSYSVKYGYCANGAEYIKKRSISKRKYRSLNRDPDSAGDITVFYDPEKPKRHYVSEITFHLALTLFTIAIGIILLYYTFQNGQGLL